MYKRQHVYHAQTLSLRIRLHKSRASCDQLGINKMNSGARDAAQTGHKRQATKTGRHVVTQGSLGDGGVLRRRGEPELGRNLFRRRELQRD